MIRLKCRYGDSEFFYKVIYLAAHASKKPRKISIHIHPNGMVQVDAPIGAEVGEIRQAVGKRARWITKRLKQIKDHQKEVLPRQYISGESHFYLGRRYMLKVNQSPKSEGNVKLYRGLLSITTPDISSIAIKELLWQWYKERAIKIFQHRVNILSENISWAKKAHPNVRLLTMKRQWGSCSPKGKFILNPHLVKAPRDCIDYVIAHELCHLKEHNHSPKFYRLLSHTVPEWQSVKIKLDNMSEILLNQ